MDSNRRSSGLPPHYTVFIRLPFPRNGFEDPEAVEWDSAKDKALWRIISKTSNSKDLDWEAMSLDFGVTLSFLLQQSAWLYERHFEGMKLQLKKLGVAAGSTATSPRPSQQDDQAAISPLPVSGANSMVRTGSRDSTQRQYTPSTARSPATVDMGSIPGTPRPSKPLMSRNASTSTVTQSRAYQTSSKQSLHRNQRGSAGSQKKPNPPLEKLGSSQDDVERVQSYARMSASESEEEPSSLLKNTAARRGQISKKPDRGASSSDGDAEDDDDDDGSGGYLPFASVVKSARQDPAATSRTDAGRHPGEEPVPSIKHRSTKPDSSTSSADRPADNNAKREMSEQRGALSPRHRAQLEQLSPRYKRSGSEGSPSMGSSFSDLDDASVTQSALEDALLSNMQHGSIGLGIGSRMSSLRDGFSRR